MTRELRSLEPRDISALSAPPAHGGAVRFEAQAPRTARIVVSQTTEQARARLALSVHQDRSAQHRPVPSRTATADSLTPPQPLRVSSLARLAPRCSSLARVRRATEGATARATASALASHPHRHRTHTAPRATGSEDSTSTQVGSSPSRTHGAASYFSLASDRARLSSPSVQFPS